MAPRDSWLSVLLPLLQQHWTHWGRKMRMSGNIYVNKCGSIQLKMLCPLWAHSFSLSDLWDWQDQDTLPADASLGVDLRPRRLQLPKHVRCSDDYRCTCYIYPASSTSHHPCSNTRPPGERSEDLPVQPQRPAVQTSDRLPAYGGCSSAVWPTTQPGLQAQNRGGD